MGIFIHVERKTENKKNSLHKKQGMKKAA